MREGDARRGTAAGDLGPQDATALMRAWLEAMDLGIDERNLVELLQEGELSHPDLYRRGCRIHERRLAGTVQRVVTASQDGSAIDPGRTALELFDACIPAIPYAAAGAFLGREKFKLARSDSDRPRVALVTDGLGGMHGVTHTIQQIRERGVRGFDVEVIGTDADLDRRLTAVAEVDMPFYSGLKIGIPSLLAVVDALAEGRYDLIHLATPGPTGIAAWMLARVLDVPTVGSYHTELAAYTGLRTGQIALEAMATALLGQFYGSCRLVLSPSTATDRRLETLGIPPERIARWARGVDLQRFDPALRDPDLLPGTLNVLYAGRLSKEKGVELLADAFLAAREQDDRLHLVLAGGGPEEQYLRDRLGEQADIPGLARRPGPRSGLRQRRHVPVRQPDRHVWPGRGRGPGQRPAGAGRVRGWAGHPDRARGDGAPGAGRRRRPGLGAAPAGGEQPAPGAAPAGRAAWRWPARPGKRRSTNWPPATGRSWTARRPRPAVRWPDPHRTGGPICRSVCRRARGIHAVTAGLRPGRRWPATLRTATAGRCWPWRWG